MANHFPDCAEAKVTSIQYGLTLNDNVSLALPGGILLNQGIPSPVFSFAFDHTWDNEGNLSVDYGEFDQDAVEAALTSLLNSMMTTMAVNIEDWAAKAKIQRVWGFLPNTLDSVIQVTGQDFMPYTPSA